MRQSPKMRIRPATPADVPTILALHPRARRLRARTRRRPRHRSRPPPRRLGPHSPLPLPSSPTRTKYPPASPSTSPPTPPGAATTASASKTSTSPPPTAGRESAKPSSPTSPAIAVDQGCPRLEWDVLDWNASAIAVYHAVGANMQTEWRIMRLSGQALEDLARQAL